MSITKVSALLFVALTAIISSSFSSPIVYDGGNRICIIIPVAHYGVYQKRCRQILPESLGPIVKDRFNVKDAENILREEALEAKSLVFALTKEDAENSREESRFDDDENYGYKDDETEDYENSSDAWENPENNLKDYAEETDEGIAEDFSDDNEDIRRQGEKLMESQVQNYIMNTGYNGNNYRAVQSSKKIRQHNPYYKAPSRVGRQKNKYQRHPKNKKNKGQV